MAILGDFLLLISGGIAFTITYLALRNRPRPGTTTLASLLSLIALWSFLHLIEHHAIGMLEHGLMKLKLVVLAPAAFVWFAFALVFTGHRALLTRRTAALLFAWPGIISVIVWIPSSIGTPLAIWQQLQAEQGLVYWIHVGLSFSLLAAGSALIILHIKWEAGLFRRQGLAVLGAVIAAWAGAIVAVFELFGDIHLHSLPVGMVVMGGFLLWAIPGAGLTRITPIARREVMETVDAGVVAMDDNLHITNLNSAASRLLNIEEGSATGKHVGNAFDGIDRLASWLTGADPTADSKRETFEIDGKVLNCKLSPLEDRRDRFVGYVLLITDITQQREQHRELNRQKERIEEFSRMVAHDLRNPLTVVKGRIELAQQERESEHLEIAENAIDRMNTLIDDLQTLAKSGQRIEDTEVVSLEELGKQCWQVIDSPEADLRLEGNIEFEAAPDRLRQLFENLYGNAIEHGATDATIEVGEMDNGFYVADDGPGIPADESESVFEPGNSLESNGTGLGLAIVSEVVDTHDWKISLKESSMGGTRFEITGVEPL